jgi:hypothetical protein
MANETATIGQLPTNDQPITGEELLEVEGTAGSRQDTLTNLVHGVPADPRYQSTSDELDALAGLSGTGYPIRTGPGTWDIAATANAGALQGNAVSSSAPSDGQVLKWNAGSSSWEPGDAPAGGVNPWTWVMKSDFVNIPLVFPIMDTPFGLVEYV